MSKLGAFNAPPFVLISDNAIADHARAVEYDGCLKRFGDVHNECSSKEYIAFCRGQGLEVDGQVNEHAAFLATILFACRRLDNNEVKMQQTKPQDWFSPHLICRFSRIEEITTMVPPLRDKLRQLYANGDLVNPGWEPSWVYAGHTGNKRLPLESSAERELSDEHPFMLAKKNDGRATKQSKRILLMCDIGKRGLNNWPILGVCNFVDDSSETDDIQFDFGRSCRWPPNRAAWHRDPHLSQFLTTMHFIPPVLYEERKVELNGALHKITALKAVVKAKNLPTWESMLNGLTPQTTETQFNPPPPLTPEEKITLANLLGQKLREAGGEPPTEPDIDHIVGGTGIDRGNDDEPAAKWVLAKTFVANLLKTDGKKSVRNILGSDVREKYAHDPIIVVRELKPKKLEEYTLDELELFVNTEPHYNNKHLDERLQRLRSNDEITKDDIAKELQRIQRLTYHEPPKFWTLWDDNSGVIVEVAAELARHLIEIGALDPAKRNENGGVPRAVAGACKILFGLNDAADDQSMDQHAYHIAIRERYRTDVKSLARSILLRKGMLPNLAALALYHGEKIDD